MKNLLIALAAVAAFSSPALADSDSTSRLDTMTARQADRTASPDMTVEANATFTVSDTGTVNRRGFDVNDRPYDVRGNFRF